MQELKQLLGMACHQDSRLLVIGVANSITLVEEYAQELNLAVSQLLLAYEKSCKHVPNQSACTWQIN